MNFSRILTFGVIVLAFASQGNAQIGGVNLWFGATGDWSDTGAANWSQTTPADFQDQANITDGNDNVTVSTPWPQAGANPDATIVGALLLTNGATVNVAGGSTLTTDGRFGATGLPGAGNGNYNFAIGTGATLTGDGNSFHTNDGGSFGDDGRSFVGEATLSGSGTTTFEGNVTISAPAGTALNIGRTVETQATTTWTSNNTNQRGNVIVTGTWNNSGTLNRTQTNSNGGLVLNDGGTFTNTGTMNVSGAQSFDVTSSSGAGTFNQNGILNIDGTTLDASGPNVTFASGAGSTTTLLNNGGLLANLSVDNGALGGQGEVTGNVNVSNGSTISPGNSPGTLTVTGDLTIDASTVTIELGGLTPGTEYDVLNVTGAVSLLNTPTIAFQFFGAYDEAAAMEGDTFTFMTAGSGLDSGPLAFDFSQIGGSGGWTTAITATSASITRVPEPSSLAFLGLGAVGLAFRRRRS